jgi:hypothetical protein
MDYLNMLRDSIIGLSNRKPKSIPAVRRAGKSRNLDVINLNKKPSESEEEGGEEEPQIWTVNVRPGYVVERVVLAETDSVVYWEPDGIFDEEEPTKLKDYEITADQAIYVQVEVLKTGAIGIEPEVPPLDPPPPPVLIAVMPNDQESTHFEPPIGEGEGAPGTYYYKLAELETVDGVTRIKSTMGGQNIDHWLDLLTFKVRSGANPWKEWNAEEGIYYTKGFIAAGQLTLAENEDDLTYQGNKRNLEVRFREADASEPEGEETLNFEDGLSMDGEVDAAPATERDIILPIVSGISPIIVNRVGEGERNFQISLEEGGDGDNFNIKLLNVSITESGGETFVSDIGWGSAERLFYVRGGKLFLTDDAAVVDTYEVISRIQGEDFSVNPTNQSGDGLTPAS